MAYIHVVKTFDREVVEKMGREKMAVVPTDTVYGVVASAMNAEAVERVYQLKGRTPTKACIILIADIEDIGKFGITVSDEMRAAVARYWPGPYSILFKTSNSDFSSIDRGTGELAFRLPNDDALRAFLRETGPLIAPSANPEGQPPATTVTKAQEYFGDRVNVYVDGGERAGKPSTLLRIHPDGSEDILRA